MTGFMKILTTIMANHGHQKDFFQGDQQ